MAEKKTVEYTETKFRVRRVSILSAASVLAFVGVLYGLVYGVIVMVVGSAAIGFGVLSAALGVLNLVVGVLLGAAFGFIGGAVSAIFYNIAARFVGGIEVELE
jgi:predicted Co/Zn/Cd cation transporter (cation efflux family)